MKSRVMTMRWLGCCDNNNEDSRVIKTDDRDPEWAVFRNEGGLENCLKAAIRSTKDMFSTSQSSTVRTRDKINTTKGTAAVALSSMQSWVSLEA